METATRMPDTPSTEEMARLRALVPLHTLPDKVLGELLDDAGFESIGKGKMLFEQGDTDHENVYLLEGSVSLLSNGSVVDRVDAGSDTARFPLAHQLPRKYSVRAKTAVRIARIDSRLLSDALARTQTVDYQVADFEDASEDDWMSMLLQSRVLQQVPAANIQRVMMNVEQVEVAKGGDLIRQGDPGDFYYMLTRGRAVVRRDNGDGKGPSELATLGPGDAFGEEALLSDNPRNSTVTMLQDGEVLRLAKEHFLDLIHNPLLDRVGMDAAMAKVERGAIWLDLRSSEQYDESHLPGAINFPFESMRYQASSLAPDHHYVLYSNTGGRAMAGAFLLTERGFDVSVLEGGLEQGTTPEVEGAVPSGHSPAEAGPVPDEAMQERMREAELRANELEERLKLVQRDQESAAAERQQHFAQIRQAVDQARRKLVETEEQKREALAAQQQAYADMERLTGSLEEVQSERASLLDRMSEIEGLDKQLQSRLAKAERELIGERERAESATSSLEELSERLSEILEKREQEREQHARERGELKEEMTALHMELEQAQLDLEEMRENLAANEESGSGDSEELQAVERELAEAKALQQRLQEERDGLQTQLAEGERQAQETAQALRDGLDGLTAERDGLLRRLDELEGQARSELENAEARAAKLEQALGEGEASASGALQALQGELEQARSELSLARSAAEQDLAVAQAATGAVREELEVALANAQQDANERLEALQAELRQLREDNEALQSQLASGDREAGAAIEQAQARVAELEQRLDDETRQAAGEIGTKQAELDEVRAELLQLQGVSEERTAELESAARRLSELQDALDGAQQAAARDSGQLQDELDRLRAENEGLQARLSSDEETRNGALEQAQSRIGDLEGRLAGLEEEVQSRQTDLERAATAAGEAQARISELEALAATLDGKQAELDRVQQEFDDLNSRREADAGELAAARARLDELELAAEQARVRAEEQAQAHQDALERLQRDNSELQSQLDSGDRETAAALEQAQARVAELEVAQQESAAAAAAVQRQLEDLLAEHQALREEASAAGSDDEALVQLRAELLEVGQRLEERERALAAAHEEQAELIEALNTASAERETLQLAVSEKDDEQARLVDLENQVAEALRAHEHELLAHEQEQHKLREQLADESDRRHALQEEIDRLNAMIEGLSDQDSVDETGLRAEYDAVLAELAMRESEVEQLRGVIGEYVDQIREAQSDEDGGSEVAALRAELEMVREQAIRDVAHMREQLAAAETQKRRLQQADGREAISHESMRQRIEALESSLAERQRELAGAEEARHMLEDSLEDANRQLDEVRRTQEKALVEAEEAIFSRREAESARDQLQQALYRLQEDAEEAKITDLRDDRLKPSKRPIGIDSVARPRRLLPAAIGAGVILAVLEALSFMAGGGELFTVLLGLSGQ